MGQLYYSPISIKAAQVPSTQTDFPVLVRQTDTRFKTTGNGGHVANASGFDIRPYSDSGLTTSLSYELERYNASTGEIVMWVKVGSLSSSTTPIYLGYGDPDFMSDGSSPSTWSNNFLGVYHLADGTTLSVNSATGSNNGTNHGATATAGKIDGAASLASASSQYVDLGTGMHPAFVTISCWINATSFPNAYNTTIGRVALSDYWALYIKSTGKLACFIANNPSLASYDGTGSNTLSAGTTYLLHMAYGDGSLRGYVNGGLDASVNSSFTLSNNAITCDLGNDPLTAGRFWNGTLDECRISSVGRTADWITTEYNNQNNPQTFETLDTEVQIGGGQPSVDVSPVSHLVTFNPVISGKPGKRPRFRLPSPVTYGSWALPIDASGQLTEDDFLLLSSMDLD